MCARARWVERGVTITEKVKKHRWGSRYKYIDHPIYYIDYPINCIDYPINILQSEHIIKNGGVYWTRCNIKHKFPKLVYLLKVRKTSDQIEINCAHYQVINISWYVYLIGGIPPGTRCIWIIACRICEKSKMRHPFSLQTKNAPLFILYAPL